MMGNHYVRGINVKGGNRYRVHRPDKSIVCTVSDMPTAIVLARELDIVSGTPPLDYDQLEREVWPSKLQDYIEEVSP